MPQPSFLLRSLVLSSFVAPGLLLPLRATAQTPNVRRAPKAITQLSTPPIFLEELQQLTGGPTTVSFSGRAVPAQDAIQTLINEANLAPFYRGEASEELNLVSVDWQNTPFWKAAHDVEVQTGGRWSGGNAGTLTFTPRALSPMLVGTRTSELGTEQPLAAQTPYVAIRASSLSRTQVTQVRFGEELPAVPDSTELAMTAYFDPKIRATSVSAWDAKLQIREDGPSVSVPPSWPKSDFRVDLRRFFTGLSNIPLQPDARELLAARFALKMPNEIAGGTRLFRVSGQLHAVITSVPQTWTVPNLVAMPQLTRTLGKASYSVDSVGMNGDKLTVRLGVTPPTVLSIPSTWWPFANARILDARGHLLSGSEQIIFSPEKTQVEYTFRRVGAGPYSLSWDVTTEPRSLDVPFELRDVPVP